MNYLKKVRKRKRKREKQRGRESTNINPSIETTKYYCFGLPGII